LNGISARGDPQKTVKQWTCNVFIPHIEFFPVLTVVREW
jgi:hypothetical protein